MPTGGEDAIGADAGEWIKAGAVAVGKASQLIAAQAVKNKHEDGITKKASCCVPWINTARIK